MNNLALAFVTLILAVVLEASSIACSSESEPEGEDHTPAAGVTTGTDLMQFAEGPRNSATGSQDATASRKGHLVIGNLIDTSGPLAEFGEAHRKAAELAALHIAEAGGTSVTIVNRDTGSDTAKGIEAARELVNAENVAAIVGARSGEVTVAVAEAVTVPKEILLVSPSATSMALTGLEDKDFVFRTVVSDIGQGTVLATVAIGEDHETAGILYIDDAYGQGLAEQFAEVFEVLGGQVTGKAGHDDGQASYAAELKQATAGDPDVVVAISYPAQAEVYLSELVQSGYTGKILLADASQVLRNGRGRRGRRPRGNARHQSSASRENRSLKAFNTAYWEDI